MNNNNTKASHSKATEPPKQQYAKYEITDEDLKLFPKFSEGYYRILTDYINQDMVLGMEEDELHGLLTVDMVKQMVEHSQANSRSVKGEKF